MSILNKIKHKKINKNNLNDELSMLFESESLKKLEAKKLDEIFENDVAMIIEEAITGGMQMRSYESKKEAAIAAIAVALAKKNKDPLYEQLKRHRGAWKRIKDDLVRRYRGQAEMKFQQNQSRIR